MHLWTYQPTLNLSSYFLIIHDECPVYLWNGTHSMTVRMHKDWSTFLVGRFRTFGAFGTFRLLPRFWPAVPPFRVVRFQWFFQISYLIRVEQYNPLLNLSYHQLVTDVDWPTYLGNVLRDHEDAYKLIMIDQYSNTLLNIFCYYIIIGVERLVYLRNQTYKLTIKTYNDWTESINIRILSWTYRPTLNLTS